MDFGLFHTQKHFNKNIMTKVAKYNEETNVIDIVDLESQYAGIEQNFERQKDALGVDDITIKDILSKPEDQRTEEDLMKLVTRNQLKMEHDKELEKYNDYREFVEIKDIEIPYGYLPHPVYSNEDDKVICRYEPYIDYYFVRKEVKRLKEELAGTDYMVVRCYEAELAGEDAPYTKEQLMENVEKRKLMRDQINQLQAILDKQGVES